MLYTLQHRIHSKRLALIIGSKKPIQISYSDLHEKIRLCSDQLKSLKSELFILKASNTLEFIVQLLSLLSLERKIALVSEEWSPAEIDARKSILKFGTELDLDSNVVWEKVDQNPYLHPETSLILFTSGSSGIPKAVQLSKKNIQSNLRAVVQSLDFDQTEEQTLFLPLSYSFGLLGQLLPGLLSGHTITLLKNFVEVRDLFGSGLARGMWSGVPSHWEGILRLTQSFEDQCEAVTHVISAGAPMNVDLRLRLKNRFKSATLYNNYGLTEASPRVLSYSSRDPRFFEPCVGYPVGDFTVRTHEDGELCMKGSQVMLGYLEEPSETAGKIENGWLRSGDIATLSANGLVSILGRKDQLFNIGGQRTSPYEIEAALLQLPHIYEAAILTEDDPMYGTKILAFIVGSNELEQQGKMVLIECLSKIISPLKIPREFYKVEQLPKNANGKLCRLEMKTLATLERKLR